QDDPRMRRWSEFVERMEERAIGRDTSPAAAIAAFERHNAAVKAIVPSERLLVFEVREGWDPLCAFLQRPVPPVPFPPLNAREMLAQAPQTLARRSRRLEDPA